MKAQEGSRGIAPAIYVKLIPLWYMILKLKYVLPSTATDFISFVNIYYMFQPY